MAIMFKLYVSNSTKKFTAFRASGKTGIESLLIETVDATYSKSYLCKRTSNYVSVLTTNVPTDSYFKLEVLAKGNW